MRFSIIAPFIKASRQYRKNNDVPLSHIKRIFILLSGLLVEFVFFYTVVYFALKQLRQFVLVFVFF